MHWLLQLDVCTSIVVELDHEGERDGDGDETTPTTRTVTFVHGRDSGIDITAWQTNQSLATTRMSGATNGNRARWQPFWIVRFWNRDLSHAAASLTRGNACRDAHKEVSLSIYALLTCRLPRTRCRLEIATPTFKKHTHTRREMAYSLVSVSHARRTTNVNAPYWPTFAATLRQAAALRRQHTCPICLSEGQCTRTLLTITRDRHVFNTFGTPWRPTEILQCYQNLATDLDESERCLLIANSTIEQIVRSRKPEYVSDFLDAFAA